MRPLNKKNDTKSKSFKAKCCCVHTRCSLLVLPHRRVGPRRWPQAPTARRTNSSPERGTFRQKPVVIGVMGLMGEVVVPKN